ncbi:MAG: VCBS repeat-containing protein [Candidatus Sulfopaludibacter sp.]|nr:VCBS repeat-containing protein [Candidatus Sulfopaludibacter sp.]
MHRLSLLCLALPLAGAHFTAHPIIDGLRGGYQVVVADLNHDGKPDIIALASGMGELAWYENPGWQRHVIVDGMARMINCTVVGADSEGIPEIVLASEFQNQAKNSLGIVWVLRHQGDPRQPWSKTEIDRLPTAHRLRTADIDGSGKPVVINAALTGPKAEAPDYRDQAPLVFYRPGEWKRQTISTENRGVVHGVFVIDWDGDGRDEILTASFEGIHLFKLEKGGRWSRTEIARGDPAPWPKSGSSDVTVGQLGRRRFLAAIEPWHGNQVAIYRQQAAVWARQAIDSSLVDGHTIQVGDFDGDGRDDVVAGYRGQGHSVYLYHAEDAAGERWSKQVLDDGGMAAASCAVADLNGDRRVDIVCIDGSKVKWYENQGPAAGD